MNTALVGAGHVTVRPVGRTDAAPPTLPPGGSRPRARASRGVEREHTREELAELHERRREAERLRQERFGAVAIDRMV